MLIGGLLLNLSLIAFVLKASTCFFPWSSIVFICFLKAFPLKEKVNLACSILCFWSDGNISSPVRYSHLWILPDDQADILAATLLISYCSFLPLIWSLNVVIFIIWFSLNLKGLSNASVASLTKQKYGSAVHFLWILTKVFSAKYLMIDLMQFVEVLFC